MESVAYDASSNLLTTIDSNTDMVNDYDDLNRLITTTNKTYSPYKVIGYSYYEDGLRKLMTEPEGGLVEYTYDKAKRLKTVKRNSITESTYDYNTLGLRTRLTLGNGAYTEYEYNHPLNWLTKLSNKKSDGLIISLFAYTLDRVGNRTSMALANGDLVVYAYDSTYQLINELRTGFTPYSISWSYDEVGNRLTQTKNGQLTTYTYNDANQLISETTRGLTNNYQYDNNGNMTSKSDGTNSWTWGYDYENRQIFYTDPITSANNASYIYDAGGSRISKTVSGVVEKYILDGANVIVDYDANNVVSATYVTPFLDQNLIMVRGGNTYYMQDGLGSVRNLIDASQNVQNTYDYYAFGEALNWSENIVNRYTYTAREWDSEVGQYYYRARQYAPDIGRFTQRDALVYTRNETGTNLYLYVYVKNAPVRFTDPSGLELIDTVQNLGKPPEPPPKEYRCKGNPLIPRPSADGAATMVCDGTGGIRIHYGWADKKDPCIKDCVQQHEGIHKTQCLDVNKEACKGQKDGTPLGVSDDFKIKSECDAHTDSVKCWSAKLKDPNCCKYKDDITKLLNQSIASKKHYCNLLK